MIAHVLVGSPVPLAVQWVAAVMLFGGLVAAVALRGRWWRIGSVSLALLGLVGTATTWTFAALQPGAPPYSLRIVSPAADARVSSPLTVGVCGVRGDGTTLPATDAAHYLVVSLDGHEVVTVDQSEFAELVAPGAHTITVQLVTPAHHAFSPPATATVRVDVASGAPTAPPANC